MAHSLGLSYNLLRGGSWNNNARNCRAANRNRNNALNQNNNIGFRVLLVSSS
ncbi:MULTISPECIES: SUMF1/EgtB/PvdO family nonheme iron enzyme [Pseudanabaena]|uniref:SUMF1/EgtB/PvdO family nonheme iron enzyme n=1 Tax=Pseudanabaena TaxID=1152 RepID=UPI0011817F77